MAILHSHEGSTADALHVFTSNKRKDEFNDSKLDTLNSPVYEFSAKDFRTDQQSGQLHNLQLSDKISKAGGLHSKLRLAISARVMLTVNIDVEDGLVSGAIGSVVVFLSQQSAKGKDCVGIWTVFDNPWVGRKSRATMTRLPRPDATLVKRHEGHITVGSKGCSTTIPPHTGKYHP